ncbi:MAG: asparaginase [Candidatus Zixiibacteriota bacterium]|nr:MAG: asparaginase [candidate division Zixibacteria bacterium]
MSIKPEPIAKVIRGEVTESVHFGSIAVADAGGRLLYGVGDPYMITYLRSSAKPFQAIAAVESGAAKAFGFSSSEIAIIAGSHSGEDKHVDTVKSILDKIGLGPEHLKCGIQTPIGLSESVSDPEGKYTVLHHNCSGKHAGMLAMAKFKTLSLDDYLSPAHPVQQLIAETISEICHYPVEKIGIGIDGCSAPVHALPLYNMAYGFARLVTPNTFPAGKAQAVSTVYMAMMDHPHMVGGTGRFDTVIAETPGEKIVAKAGAEALECFALPDRNWGAAVKITDGSKRALFPVTVELLYKLGVRSRNEEISKFHRPIIENWRKIEVGIIEPGFELKEVNHE